jgi:hypothetical protein
METKFGRQGFFGTLGENAARRLLKEMGYFVLPASLIDNGGAPLLESQAVNLIMPDIIAAHHGVSVLVDVKTKGRATKNMIRKRLETGCSLRHYESYLAAGRALGMRVALLFIHADRAEGQFGFLDEVSADAHRHYPKRPDDPFGEPMIFFNIDLNHGSQFKVCLFKDDLEWAKLKAASIPAKTVRPWESDPRKSFNGQGLLPGW